MNQGVGGDPFARLKGAHEHYKVFDAHYENVGKVDDLFVDADDRPIYIGVKMGFLGINSTVVPLDLVRVNDRRRVVEISSSKDHIEHAPSFEDNEDITPEMEDRIRRYFGLGGPRTQLEEGVRAEGRPEDELVPDERVDLVPGAPRTSGASTGDTGGHRTRARRLRR